jgi:hypothetical protein
VAETKRKDAEALDALAAADAALGWFDEAIATALEALQRVPGGDGSPAARDIRDRIALYRAGRAFTLPR